MKSTLKKTFSSRPDFWLAVLVIIIMGLIGLAGGFEKLELRVYDGLLRVKPSTVQNPDIMTVNVDDYSLDNLGVWPWSRDILADALIRMRECGAKCATFDIEYIEESQLGVDPDTLRNMPKTFMEGKETVSEMIRELSGAFASGQICPADAMEMADELLDGYINPALDNLYDSTSGKVLRDNDEYFANAIRFFGNTWLTINSIKITEKIEPELEKLVREQFLLNNVTDKNGYIKKDNEYYNKKNDYEYGMTPALKKLLEKAAGGGFTNVVVDADGSRRRVELLRENNGQYIGQLAFAPLMNMLEAKSFERKKHSLIVHGAKFPGEEKEHDVRIPLDEHGRVLINWVSTNYKESFKYESVYFLLDADKIESQLIANLRSIETFHLGNSEGQLLSYYDVVSYLLGEYDQKLIPWKERLLKGETDNFDEYFAARKEFFENCNELNSEDYLGEILSVLSTISINDVPNIDEVKENIAASFDVFKQNYELYMSRTKELSQRYNNAFCVIGNTATGSTDLGSMPFYERYPNVGTHANLYNMILERQFITPVHWIYGFIFASLLSLIMSLSLRKLRTRYQNFIGGAGVVLFPLIASLLMIIFRIYLPPLIPTLVMALYFLGSTIMRFIMSERDKKWLRNTLSTFVSPAVVGEFEKHPELLELGGKNFPATAIFTDIRSFSTISERVSADYLVEFLNEYLSLLSDVILNYDGTIDKYEGDAIIALWGAPLEQVDHAWRSCISAIRMKQAEADFNKKMLANGTIITKDIPAIGPNGENKQLNKIVLPIATRIGLNSGEMVVGNMGTKNKKNYTMMGTNVNLAARLEGVNKVYQTWILASEYTWNMANYGENKSKLVSRKLDRVRVIGIKDPVQLYNIVGLKSEMSSEQLESVSLFNQAMEKYLNRDFVNAKKLFEVSYRTYPETVLASKINEKTGSTDVVETPYSPSIVFIKRCEEYIRSGVPENWDGVVNMTSK